MNFESTVIAAVLLLSPTAEPQHDLEYLPLLRPAFMALAVNAELIGEDERRIFKFTDNSGSDLANLHDLVIFLQRAPHLAELSRFPDVRATRVMARDIGAWQDALRMRAQFDIFHAEAVDAALGELYRRGAVYSRLYDAQWPQSVHIRRKALEELRDLLGDVAFYSGFLPPEPAFTRR